MSVLADRLRGIVRGEVAKYRVPPQMELSVVDKPLDREDNEVAILLVGRWPDAEGKRDMIATYGRRCFDPHIVLDLPTGRLVHIIHLEVESLVRELWNHELNEWFTYAGVHVRAPHRPDGSFA